VELQEVAEIIDPVAAKKLGVRLGQVTLQYHAGGGALAGQLGALFGRRKHSSLPLRSVMAIEKPLFHLASSRSLEELRRRLALYFSAGCPPVERDSVEGERLMAANAAAMNYGFAFRLTTYASLRRMAVEAFGPMRSHLVVDSPHNSIYEEDVAGELALVHRHNSSRAFPAAKMRPGTVFGETGQAVLLPGTHRTSSYLCVATAGASRSLYSASHGAGSTVGDFAARGLSRLDPERRTTTRFAYSGAEAEIVAQLDDRGVDEALKVLTSNDLLKPVARMRPFAVLN
jgi:tRNA-splicing ligase RtcB